MTRYFLHLYNGQDHDPDGDGYEFATASQAAAQAAVTAGEVMRDDIAEALVDRHLRIVVEDDAKNVVAEVEMSLTAPNINKS